ncbi:hypothetical protein L1987_61383 [Smallanthus sonchifolius]|uniref:Uncharacterized protein n=1 Tax=Smallanthus sonchifolius TaxID=185202 RepID=A0ACB9C7F5_9ASTR|nr:hypothetical protein L1987_61383 [Smallanthus sonchifolius]
MNLARKANRENDIIKRAIQSLGCRIHVSGSDDCTINIESSLINLPERVTCSRSTRESPCSYDEKMDMPISVALTPPDNNDVPENPILRVCENLCPQRTREGGCKWPDASCAQLESQFVGLRANYDDFDRVEVGFRNYHSFLAGRCIVYEARDSFIKKRSKTHTYKKQQNKTKPQS